MEFIDLKAQYMRGEKLIQNAIQNVLDHGQFIKGPEVYTLEKKLAEYVGVKHCIAMSNGTTALQIALMTLDIRPGDEIITTPFSFFATAEVIYLLGAKPIYVDIDPRTYNINPNQIEAAITSKTKAILPVSLYGQCPDFDTINKIAEKYNIAVIEDGAQSFGASYKERKSCGLSTIGCTSFFPSKPLGCYGDGGACFTNDDQLAKSMRLLIDHGQESRYNHVMIGMNGRLDTIQAAILLAKLSFFDDELALRQRVAAHYNEILSEIVNIPYIEPHNISAYAQYTINIDNRDHIQTALKKKNIPTAIHYPKGLHEQPISLKLERNDISYPIAELSARNVLSLPFHPYLDKSSVEIIAKEILNNLRAGVPQ